MLTTTRSTTARDDIRALNETLRRRQLPGWLLRTGVLAGVAIVWFWACQQILRAGSVIRYDGLEALGQEVVRLLTQINPYLWWGVIAILSLIVLSVARAWFIRSTKRSRIALIPVADIQKLASSMSPEGLQVLRWVWDSTADPVTVGDLIVTRQQIQSGRVRKLAMAHSQLQAIEQGAAKEGFNLRGVRAHTIVKSEPDSGKVEPVL